jgi:hypothetical protein
VNAVAPRVRPVAAGMAMPRARVIATAAFAIFSLGATVTVFAAFIALLIGGGAGAHELFALVVGSLAFSTLVLIQFMRRAVVLLQASRGRI